VFAVDAGAQHWVLKRSGDGPLDVWRRKCELHRLAAEANLAPRIVHVDDDRRAVLSERIADRGFPARYGDPRTRDAAVALLGRTLKRVHELPIPEDAERAHPHSLLAEMAKAVRPFAPPFASEAMQRVLDEDPPPEDRPLVLSHNDVNPGNIVDDGERLLLVDWETAAPNEPLYDLAAIATFLRMDDATALAMLAAHDGAPASKLPARFVHLRRVVATLCGATFLQIARAQGHEGRGDETLESTPSLGDFYGKLRAGAVELGTKDGQWAFGLALLKESSTV
jgi:aminoglycoside phosphotransferase (APT) family kinase protein